MISKEACMKYATAIVVLMFLLAGCSDEKSTSPQEPRYYLSGLVTNQNGTPVVAMEIILQGQHGISGVWHTRSDGTYGGGTFRADSIAITYGSESYEVFGIPNRTRFIPFSTTLYVDYSRVYNLSIREFMPIFYDSGDNPSYWIYHNARPDSNGHILSYHQGDTTFISMRSGWHISGNAYRPEFIFYGQTFPSGSGEIAVTAEVNGVPVSQVWRSTFGTRLSYSQFSLDMIDSLPGSDIQLSFTFNRITADSIRLNNFRIYSY
jgi:hypothetical protein